jgi:hypothetical protein
VSAGPRATRATGGRDDQLPYPHITLTLDECDAIDIAKSRIRRLASLLADLLKNKREYGHHEDSEPAMADLVDVILQDVEAIDVTLAAADKRRLAREASGGGQ